MKRIAVFLCGLCVGCPSRNSSPDVVVLDVQQNDIAEDVPPEANASTIGEACEAPTPGAQGTCSAGEVCAPFRDGYCLRFCERSTQCPTGARCVDSPRMGDLCLRSCSSSADCREGYSCDPRWNVCSLTGLLSVKPPQCTAALPARRTFGAVRQLSPMRANGGFDWEPAAALGSDGRLVVSYTARPSASLFDTNQVMVTTVRADGTVETPRVLRTERRDHYDVWMATDRMQQMHLVWLGHDGLDVNGQIGYASSSDGTTWSAPRGVHDPRDCMSTDGCLDKPMIAIGPDPSDATRDLMVVCYAANGERCRRSLDGGRTFENSVRVGNGFYGDVRIDRAGVVHLVLPEGPGGNMSVGWFGATANQVIYFRSGDGARTFERVGQPSSATDPHPMYFHNPQVVRDVMRNATYVVYTMGGQDGAWNIMLATSMDEGRTWTRVRVNDDAPCATHLTPALALDEQSGEVHVLWLENRNGAGLVGYARCASGGARCGANERINEQPFASFALVRQSPRWMGEYHSLLIDATRRRIHAVWTQTVTEQERPVARIFASSGTL